MQNSEYQFSRYHQVWFLISSTVATVVICPRKGVLNVNKFLTSLVILTALAIFSTPAAAQLSGFVSLDGPAFGVRLGLNYASAINPSTTLTFGARYNVFISPASPSAAAVFINAETLLTDRIALGGRIALEVSDIGASNTLALGIRPYISAILVSSSTFGVTGTLSLNTPIVPNFALQPWLAIDGSYLTGPLRVDFGAEADFTIVPAFSFDAIVAYLHGSYQLSDQIGLFAGTGFGFAGNTFGLAPNVYGQDYDGIYAGLNFALSNAITVRAVGGYFGGVNFTLTTAFRL